MQHLTPYFVPPSATYLACFIDLGKRKKLNSVHHGYLTFRKHPLILCLIFALLFLSTRFSPPPYLLPPLFFWVPFFVGAGRFLSDVVMSRQIRDRWADCIDSDTPYVVENRYPTTPSRSLD